MGIFDKFKTGLQKTRDFLNQGFKQIRMAFGGSDEELLEELEMLFIQADMGQACSTKLLDELRTDLKESKNHDQEHILSVLRQSMLRILGPKQIFPITQDRLQIILLLGVNGTGKTTTAGKLCKRFKDQGYKVMLAAADTFRAAAVEQLQIWAGRTHTELISQQTGADPAAVVYDALSAAAARGTQILIIDTAGRLHNKQNLMDELAKMRRIVSREAPQASVASLLVIDATSGQNALLQADAFNKLVDLDGLVITKLDGNAKGGITLAVADLIKVPIYFAGLGEGEDDLLDFDPLAFAGSLLPEEGSL